ncbi:MAG: DUF4116 domain-containing protein, partial [Myxococcota bacterium]
PLRAQLRGQDCRKRIRVPIYFDKKPALPRPSSFEECAGQNRHSPRPCWRLDAFALVFAWCQLSETKKLFRDRGVVLAAVRKSYYALNVADDSLKRDREIVVPAVNRQQGPILHCTRR